MIASETHSFHAAGRNNIELNRQFPQTIVMTLADVCTRTCEFCPRGCGYVSPHDSKYMSMHTVEKIARDAGCDYTGVFSLSGFGEPTLHPDICEIIRCLSMMCKDAHIRVITNADNISQLLRLEHIANLTIEVSQYEPPVDTIRDQLNNCENIVILRELSVSRKLFNNRAGNCNVVTDNCSCTGICTLPMYKTSIDVNGDVLLCCSDWTRKLVLGNVHVSSISDIWRGEHHTHICQELAQGVRSNCVCSRCNTIGTLVANDLAKLWRN